MAHGERVTKLQAMLEKSPGDTFLLYALAIEHKKAGETAAAIDLFDQVTRLDWGYCYAYHQKGLTLEAAGDMEGAKSAYRAGMDAAARKGDGHAREEIAAALSMIEEDGIAMLDGILRYLNNPEWRRQHRSRKALWTNLSRLGLNGMHALPMNRRWVEIHRRAMPLPNLDPAMVGMKIVQISDLHYSPVVWKRYLIQYLQWVNDLNPHLVVVTGDLITGGYRYAHRVATILSHLKAQYGVICTFGNHDYSIYGKRENGEGQRRANYLEKCLKDRGLIVLRNQTFMLRAEAAQKSVAIVGLDDEWSENMDPAKAFAGVDADLPIICLNHNPVNVKELMIYPWQWMLSGHTHGRQVATSKLGKALYPHRFRHYTHGYYSVEGRNLYVNRGISYGQRMLDWCRPEITVFKLENEGSATEIST